MKILFIVLLAGFFIDHASSECCYQDYYGRCADGGPRRGGHWCGLGPCNIIGCNCDGGCIKPTTTKFEHTINGKKCESDCEFYNSGPYPVFGLGYYWCKIGSSWDYCRPYTFLTVFRK